MDNSKHIAIIPDGNRRWAKVQHFLPWQGHEEGVKRFWEIAYAAFDNKVSHITFWAASYDNLKKRSKIEVEFLLKLLANELENPKLLKSFIERKVKFNLVGEWRDFIKDKNVIQSIENIISQTEKFSKYILTILFVYDGQREMLSAINALKQKRNIENVDLRKVLWTGDLPDVDLVIRTGGQPHWSAGFMMWLTANSQFYFTEKLWPEFTKNEFNLALNELSLRQRRFGK